MYRPDLRDPNDRIYAVSALIATAIVFVGVIVALSYFVVCAPSEWDTLDAGTDSTGSTSFLACSSIFLVCSYLLVKDFLKRIREHPESGLAECTLNSPIGKAGILFAITVVTSLALLAISELIREPITSSFLDEMESYDLMASMMCAGPSEELMCRVGLIGIPVFLVCCYHHRGSVKDIFGGFGMSRTAMVFLTISSVVFGLLHLDGWSLMKFPDTFITGMLFGYVYIKYGLHTIIFMHSAFDMIMSFDIFSEWLLIAILGAMTVLGTVLLVRSLLDYRRYIPDNNLHEPFDGTLVEMWERD